MDTATSEDRVHDERATQRVRYEARLRTLTVAGVRQLTPHLTSVTLSGDFSGFQSPSFCDHIKLFFPDPVTGVLNLPGGDGAKPIARDYTPRRFDLDAQTLDIEFALHGTGADCGPATQWAMKAKPGDTLTIGGPRGSTIIPLAFDAYLLIGDDTALPAIARRVQELPATTLAIAVVEVADASARIDFATAATLQILWCYRNASSANGDELLRVVSELPLPTGEGYVWAAGESSAIRAVRQHLLGERGIDKSRLHASGYWKRGAQDVHDHFED